MAVADHLSRLGAAGAETHPVDHAVQPALQVLHHVVAGDALLVRGLFKPAPELTFQHAVDAAHFLLLPKLQAVAYDLRLASLPVLSGNEVALFDSALLAVAALAFQIKFHALAPALPADRADISRQVALLLPNHSRCGLQPLAGLLPAYHSAP